MKIFLMIILLGTMISSTIVSWSLDFFGDVEKIELTKLADGESEDSEEKSEKELRDKIRYQLHLADKKMEAFQKHAWFDEALFSKRYREVLTPPPDFS